MDMNEIIVSNILNAMKERSLKQIELAESIHVSKQTMSKMLNGERTISASELSLIANAMKVSIAELVKNRNSGNDNTPLLVFMGDAGSKEAKMGIEALDTFSSLICFHLRCKQNGEKMMESWDE